MAVHWFQKKLSKTLLFISLLKLEHQISKTKQIGEITN